MIRTLIFLLLLLGFINSSQAAVPTIKAEFATQLSPPYFLDFKTSGLRIKVTDGFLLAYLKGNKLEIRKLSDSGEKMNSFGVNGEASIRYIDIALFKKYENRLGSIYVNEEGDIFVSMQTGLNSSNVENRQVHLFKFSADGTPDKNFGKKGWSMRMLSSYPYDSNFFTKTFITGSTNNRVLLGFSLGFSDTTFIRINQDGTIDRTFADDGMKSFASHFQLSEKWMLSGSKQSHIGVQTSALKTDADKTYHSINSIYGVWYIDIDGALLGDINLKSYSASVLSEYNEDEFNFYTQFATDIVDGEQYIIAKVGRSNEQYDKSLMIFKLKDRAIDLTFGTEGIYWVKGDENYFFDGRAEYARDGGLLFTYSEDNPEKTYFRYLSPTGVQTSPTQIASFNTKLSFFDNTNQQANPISFETFNDGRRLVYTDEQGFYKLDKNGRLDRAFLQGSDLTTKSDSQNTKPYAIDSNNNIYTYRNSSISRFNQFGEHDVSFLEGKESTLKVEGYSRLKVSWIEPNIDGGVDVFLIDHNPSYQGEQKVIILRLDEHGSRDFNFGQNGQVVFAWKDLAATFGYKSSQLKVFRNDKNETFVMVTMAPTTAAAFITLFKLDAHGNFITEFGNNGVTEIKLEKNIIGTSITSDNDAIYITGVRKGLNETKTTGFIVKLNQNGLLQVDFASEGVLDLGDNMVPKAIWILNQQEFYALIDGGEIGRTTYYLKSFDFNGNGTSDYVDADSFLLSMSEDMMSNKPQRHNYSGDWSTNQFIKLDANKVEILTSTFYGARLYCVDFTLPLEFKSETIKLTVAEDSGNTSILLPQISANSSELVIINSPFSGIATFDNNNDTWEVIYRPKPNFFGDDNFVVEVKTENVVLQYLITVEIVPQEDPIIHNTRLAIFDHPVDSNEVIVGTLIGIFGEINTFDRPRDYGEAYNFDIYTWYADDEEIASGAAYLVVEESMLGKTIRFDGIYQFKEGWQKTYSISTREPIGNVEVVNSDEDKSGEDKSDKKSSGALEHSIWLILLIILRRYLFFARPKQTNL